MSDNETIEKHASYGIISFNRSSGTGRLFGSPLPQHFGTIRLVISHGEREHEYGEDRYRDGKQIIEVELSASQFAEAITCMGIMPGVPCTLRWMPGVGRVDDVPATEESEMHRATASFRSNVKGIVASVRKQGQEITAILAKDKLSKEDKSKIARLADYVIQEVDSNAPFFVEQFTEATGKVAQRAKAEVAAMLDHVIRSAGMEHVLKLRNGSADQLPKLPAHDDRDEYGGEP
jgi:hypothetical protein